MTLTKRFGRTSTLRSYRNMLGHESLEPRTFLSAVPQSELAEQLASDPPGLVSDFRELGQDYAVRRQGNLGEFKAGLGAVGLPVPDLTLDLNQFRGNRVTPVIVNANTNLDSLSGNGLAAVNLIIDAMASEQQAQTSFEFTNGMTAVDVVPLAGSNFVIVDLSQGVFAIEAPSWTGNPAGNQDFRADASLPSASQELPGNTSQNSTTPTLIDGYLSNDLDSAPEDSPLFGWHEPRLQELSESKNPAGAVDGRGSSDPNVNPDFDPATSTVDIAGILSDHATPRGPRSMAAVDTGEIPPSSAWQARDVQLTAASYSASIIDRPNQGRLRMVEIATDSPLVHADMQHPARPVAVHKSETFRPVSFDLSAPRKQRLDRSESVTFPEETKALPAPSRTEGTLEPSAEEPSTPTASWDRLMHQIAGRWSRYLELTLSSVLATGMVFLYQLKLRERDRELDSVVQFRRWYTAAFMDRNNTSAAPKTNEQ